MNLGIFHHISRNVEVRKIRNNFGKTSTHRAENIFPKYYVHEIARKYPREKKRYSSFSDSVGDGIKQEKSTVFFRDAGGDNMFNRFRR